MGLSVIALIVAGFVVLAGLNYTLDTVKQAEDSAQDTRTGQLDTALALSNVTMVNDTAVRFSVTNVGKAGISNLSRMDVIMSFTNPGTGRPIECLWLTPATQAGALPGGNLWYCANVTTPAEALTNTTLIMPGETMTAIAIISGSVPSDMGTLEVGAPNGVTTATQFVLE